MGEDVKCLDECVCAARESMETVCPGRLMVPCSLRCTPQLLHHSDCTCSKHVAFRAFAWSSRRYTGWKFHLFICLIILLFWARALLCSPGWPGIHSNSPASAPWVLRVCCMPPSLISFFKKNKTKTKIFLYTVYMCTWMSAGSHRLQKKPCCPLEL